MIFFSLANSGAFLFSKILTLPLTFLKKTLQIKEHIKETVKLAIPISFGQLGHVMMGVVDSMMDWNWRFDGCYSSNFYGKGRAKI